MSKHEEQTQDPQALHLLKELLKYKSAQDFRSDLNELFYAYLQTECADCKSDRKAMAEVHLELIDFLTKLSKLKSINIYG